MYDHLSVHAFVHTISMISVRVKMMQRILYLYSQGLFHFVLSCFRRAMAQVEELLLSLSDLLQRTVVLTLEESLFWFDLQQRTLVLSRGVVTLLVQSFDLLQRMVS